MGCISYGPVSYQESEWVAGWLPVQYKLHSTKWPENNIDAEESITSVADDNGFAKVTISGPVMSYTELEYIKIYDSTVSAYDGVWQIVTKHSSTVFTISADFSATATGTLQRYYNNYHIKTKVYTGIPAGHTLAANRPMTERGTISIKPDLDNNAIIDISSYIHADISPIRNNLCSILPEPGWIGNDWYNWTGFYISYAESYDVSDGSEVTTYTTPFVNDTDQDSNINYFFAANAVHQFQHYQGKSMGEYAIADTSPDIVPAKWMTDFDEPIYFEGWEFDISILVAQTTNLPVGYALDYTLVQYDSLGNTLATDTQSMNYDGVGLYRFGISKYTFNASCDYFTLKVKDNANDLTNNITIHINRDCSYSPIYLRWFNIHANWEGWLFRKKKVFNVDIKDRTITRRNIYSNWDSTFRTGDTQDDYISTEAYEEVDITTGRLTLNEVETLKWLRLSNKVFEIFPDESVECGGFRQRTVLILPSTFTVRKDTERFYTASFTMRYTDQILVQGQ